MECSDDASWQRRLVRWGLWLAFWTLRGLFDAVQTYVRYRVEDAPAVTWPQAVALGLSLWYAWAILAIFVARLARRYPIEQRNWPTRIPFHLAAGAIFAAVKLVIDYPIIEAFYCPAPGLMRFDRFYIVALAGHFHHYVLIYWAMLGVCHALNYYRKFQERDLRTSQLEARLALAQLQCLKMQLHPHFLFNTLNAISALIHKDT